MKLAELLTPHRTCVAVGHLRMRDRRKGALWFCSFSRRIIGKGRQHPGCQCAAILADAGREYLATKDTNHDR